MSKCIIPTNEEVIEAVNIILSYCKDREDRHASCIHCPIRKSYGTRQPECCKLHMIERPSKLIREDE